MAKGFAAAVRSRGHATEGHRRRSEEAAAIRFAWWAAFFATLTLVAVLGIAKSAQALTVPPAGTPGIVAAPAPPAG